MSLKDKAIDSFFAAVRSEKIRSGSTLSQSELSEILDISLSPLREALKLLEFQGFVRILPRSGVEIVESDMQRIKDCFQLRRILESAGVRRFVEFEPSQPLKKILDQHLDLLSKIEDKNGNKEIQATLFELDQQMHTLFMSSLKNDIIMPIYETNQDRIMLFRVDSIILTRHSLTNTCKEHIAILRAALEGDVEGAADAMDAHLIETMHRAMAI